MVQAFSPAIQAQDPATAKLAQVGQVDNGIDVVEVAPGNGVPAGSDRDDVLLSLEDVTLATPNGGLTLVEGLSLEVRLATHAAVVLPLAWHGSMALSASRCCHCAALSVAATHAAVDVLGIGTEKSHDVDGSQWRCLLAKLTRPTVDVSPGCLKAPSSCGSWLQAGATRPAAAHYRPQRCGQNITASRHCRPVVHWQRQDCQVGRWLACLP